MTSTSKKSANRTGGPKSASKTSREARIHDPQSFRRQEVSDDGSRIIYLCISDEQRALIQKLTDTGLYGYTAEATALELLGRALRDELGRAHDWELLRNG